MSFVNDAITLGLNGVFSYGAYKDSREKGRGVATSIGAAAFDFAFYEVIGAPMTYALMGMNAVSAGAKIAHQMGFENANVSSKQYSANFGGHGRFRDTEIGATMRSRGLQAIQQSGIQGYSVLGNEARQYFR